MWPICFVNYNLPLDLQHKNIYYVQFDHSWEMKNYDNT
jgi:hypothetical protein